MWFRFSGLRNLYKQSIYPVSGYVFSTPFTLASLNVCLKSGQTETILFDLNTTLLVDICSIQNPQQEIKGNYFPVSCTQLYFVQRF